MCSRGRQENGEVDRVGETTRGHKVVRSKGIRYVLLHFSSIPRDVSPADPTFGPRRYLVDTPESRETISGDTNKIEIFTPIYYHGGNMILRRYCVSLLRGYDI